PPPVGIDEITYIKLAMLERGCQYCGAKTETPKVYWAFRVRCCSSCLRKRITTPDNLPHWAKTPIDITTVVPYENVPVLNSTTGAKIIAYLNSHLESARREFISTPPKHRANWIQKKKNMVAQILTNVQKRERLDELYLRKKSLEDMRTFKMLIEEFKQTKDEKGLKPYKEKYIVQLPSYIEAKE
ncbi:9304_t:CDS:2, partial [Dentiscutata heterogama]